MLAAPGFRGGANGSGLGEVGLPKVVPGLVPLEAQMSGGEEGSGGKEQEQEDNGSRGGLAARPEPELLEPGGGLGLDGPSLQPSLQVVGQSLSRGIACGGLLAEAFEANGFEGAVQAGLKAARRNRFGGADAFEGFHGSGADKRRAAGEQLVEN